MRAGRDELEGKIVLVTGASRGVGRGIALALGSCGAKIYLTARSHSGRTTVPLPGTIEQTAEEIERTGGTAVPLICDHADDLAVSRVFDTIRVKDGGLDILVNNAWAGYQNIQKGMDTFDRPFWDVEWTYWDEVFRVGVRSAFVAASLAVPLMCQRQGGLIVNVSSYAGSRYSFNVIYGVAKAAVDRMASDMAIELRPHNIASVSLWPGTVRTEMNEVERPPDYADAESPNLAGYCIALLATDPSLMGLSGKILETRRLARRYGICDVDGSTPDLHKGLFGDGSFRRGVYGNSADGQ